MSTLKSVYIDGEISGRGSAVNNQAKPDKTFLLHEAARKYDCEQIKSLLGKGEDPEARDKEGKTVLHVLLSDGFLGHLYEANMEECLQVILDKQNTNVNINTKDDNGESPLSLAVSNGFELCATLLVKHGADPSVRTKKYKGLHSLSSAIANTMPDVMVAILDSGVTLDYAANNGKNGAPEVKVKLDWRPVLQFSEAHEKESEKRVRKHKYKQREMSFLYTFLDLPLNSRNIFLTHPLVSAFLHLKSRTVSRKLRWFQMALSLYPVFYMIFIYFLYFNRCKFNDDTESDETDTSTQSTLINHSSGLQSTKFEGKLNDNVTPQRCEISLPISVCAYLLMLVVIAFGLVEIYMQLRIDTRYTKNWRTWVLRVSLVIMGLTLWPALQFNTLYNISWQYPIAALGTFFSWVMFLIQLELIPQVKVYLEMLVAVTISVIKITVLFCPLLIGFYMGFNLMFFEIGGVMNFILMTVDVGSDNYEGMIESAKDKQTWFMIIAYGFSITFIVIIAIVFMNFLLGASINDVQELKRNAKIITLSNKVQSMFVIDLIFPSRYRVVPEPEMSYSYVAPYEEWEFPEELRTGLILLLKSKYSTRSGGNMSGREHLDKEQKIQIGSLKSEKVYSEILNRIEAVENKIQDIMDHGGIQTEF